MMPFVSITIMQWRIYMRKVCICEVCDFVSKQNTHHARTYSFFLSLFLSLYLRGLAKRMISPVRLVYISSRTEQNLKPNTLNKNTIYTSLCVYILSLSILHCRWFTLMTNLAPVDLFEVISNKKIFDYRFVSWPKAEIKHRENVLITTRWYI